MGRDRARRGQDTRQRNFPPALNKRHRRRQHDPPRPCTAAPAPAMVVAARKGPAWAPSRSAQCKHSSSAPRCACVGGRVIGAVAATASSTTDTRSVQSRTILCEESRPSLWTSPGCRSPSTGGIMSLVWARLEGACGFYGQSLYATPSTKKCCIIRN